MINIETNNTQVIELMDNRTILRSEIVVNNSIFMNHLQGYEIYLTPDDIMIFTNCDYTTFSVGCFNFCKCSCILI